MPSAQWRSLASWLLFGVCPVWSPACCLTWGEQAWLLWVVWLTPQAVWRDGSRAHLLGLSWRTQSLRLGVLHGLWGGARGGVPEGEGRRAGALHGN